MRECCEFLAPHVCDDALVYTSDRPSQSTHAMFLLHVLLTRSHTSVFFFSCIEEPASYFLLVNFV